MKVVYDITTLGGGFYSNRSRAGIFRYVESLARELNRSANVDLNLWAGRNFHHLECAYHYYRSQAELQDCTFLLPENFWLKLATALFFKKYPSRSDSRYYLKLKQLLQERVGEVMIGAKADIFHSTFFPLPESINPKRIRRFLTVYDLIPIYHPQYCDEKLGVVDTVKKIMHSIGPEDGVLAISETTKNDLCNYLPINPKRVYTTYLGASSDFYPCYEPEKIKNVMEKYKIPSGNFILSLNTIEPRKNIILTIRAFIKFIQQEKVSDLNLVLAGGRGWKFEGIYDEIKSFSDYQERIIFTGYVDDRDQAALYSGAMMFAFPSFYEGFGLPLLEAMQCGVPVISSDRSSMPEVVGDAGLLINPDDEEMLCHAIATLYGSPSRREELSAKGLKRAGQFSWQKCAEKTIAAYRELL